MKACKQFIAGVAALAVALAAAPIAAQSTYEPQVGQAGKDVIWVPTPPELVERMLVMAQTRPEDFVVDLGSGDGRIAIAAAKQFGARALGIEYNPDMVALSKRNAEKEGVAGGVEFVRGDIFETDFTRATVVTMYLLPTLNYRLRPQLLDMRPGTRIVAHQFEMGDWEPDETTVYEGRRAYLWIVPARVAGAWKLSMPGGDRGREYEMVLTQRFQKPTGTVQIGPVTVGLREVILRGDLLRFAFVDDAGVFREFAGRVNGGVIEGGVFRAGDGSEGAWSATKK